MRRSGKALIVAGVLLIAVSLGILLTDHIQTKKTMADASGILEQLAAVLPPRTTGMPDTYSNMQMPALQVGAHDVIAILKIPAFGIQLPVCSSWEENTGLPKRFSGSVYDDSLIIGASGTQGQFDCFDTIQDGAEITVTDMTGAEFTYTVARIQRSDSAAAQILKTDAFDLTLFTRDALSMEYLILRCVR